MVKIFCNGDEIKTKIAVNWSGDYEQAARVLTFDYLAVEKACHVGDKIQLFDDEGNNLFLGQVNRCEYNTDDRTFSVVCYDLLYNLLKSKAAGRFQGTAAQICNRICAQFNLISKITLGGEVQEIITTGDYTYFDVMVKAIKKSIGKDVFNIRIENGNQVVLDLPGGLPVHQLSSYTNIGESSYGESIENMVNRILTVDIDGEILETKENSADVQRFGIFQDVEKEKDTEEDDLAEKELHSVDYTAALQGCLGKTSCIAGKTVAVVEPNSGFIGNFFIMNDSHTWEDEIYLMDLGIKYEQR